MACRLCHLEIEATLCEVCRYLTEEAQPPPEQPVSFCQYCDAPIANPGQGEGYCELCGALIRIIWRNGWLNRAHEEWEEENIELARRKRELLGQEYPPNY